MAANYHCKLVEVLTGFKWIGQQILKNEHTGKGHYMFGMEESYGCLIGSYARDKDAVSATVALCEAAAYYKMQGKTLWDAMLDMFEKYGYYLDGIKAFDLAGLEGLAKIQRMMTYFRENVPEKIGDATVLSVRDYQADTIVDLKTKEVRPTGLPASNVIYYDCDDNTWICVRPSGTEPKIKFYYGVKGNSMEDARVKSDKLGNALQALVDQIQ